MKKLSNIKHKMLSGNTFFALPASELPYFKGFFTVENDRGILLKYPTLTGLT